MTIDERLEKLTERHEALTQTVELMAAMGLAADERLEKLAESLTRLEQSQERLNGRVEKILGLVEKMSETVGKLADIAQAHERRLDRLEGA